jgi:predicted TIM-barrel fold metal-dependent hydrolase
MTPDGFAVIDSVVHAFDSTSANAIGRFGRELLLGNFAFQYAMVPDPYRLPAARYFQAIDVETLESLLFHESYTDIAVFHTIPAWGFLHDMSPMRVGLALRERNPGRVQLYGGISPLQGPQVLDELDRQVAEWGIIGLKLYPVDIIDGEVRVLSFSDQDVLYPVLERCRKLGIRVIAIHKSSPLGPTQMDPFRPGDVDYAARDFPDLNFEIVHGGFAFLDETAFQVARFPNVYIGLESTSALVVRHPRKFARILGELLMWGGATKLFWSTGASSPHPRPILEAFRSFEMPVDMVEQDGYPQLTREIKQSILAGNYARVHRLDVPDSAPNGHGQQAGDSDGSLRSPWATLREPATVDSLATEAQH